MHVNDFRDDLKPTMAQWREIGREFCRLAGEEPPASRAGALELLLRLQETSRDGAAAADDAQRPGSWAEARDAAVARAQASAVERSIPARARAIRPGTAA